MNRAAGGSIAVAAAAELQRIPDEGSYAISSTEIGLVNDAGLAVEVFDNVAVDVVLGTTRKA